MGKYIPPEEVAKARQMDLLTYLQNYEPTNLVRIKDNVYSTKEHDSLKISNGMWNWWSQGIGGKSALDYLIKVRGMDFQQAVETIIGDVSLKAPVPVKVYAEEKKIVAIPERNATGERAKTYLMNRGIDEGILNALYEQGLWYETEPYHNVAFVGKDMEGNIKLIALRGTESSFKNTAPGSDRAYPFCIKANVNNNVLHLFEAPIDAISYASLMKQMGIDWKQHNFLALCGIYQPKENIEESAVPVAVKQYLKDNPGTKTVCLHLDTDGPGRNAAKALQIVVAKLGVTVIDQPPPAGFKDCNDYLMRCDSVVSKENKERGVTSIEETRRS